jgi:predicted HD phosphohydrolase
MEVCEVASASAGDEDFLADPVSMLEHCYTAAALSSFDGAH